MENLNEIWIDVNEFENCYKISNFGNLISKEKTVSGNGNSTYIRTEKPLKSSKTKKGYTRVDLRDNNNRKICFVHRLVAEHFIPKIEGKEYVNHINGIKDDNRYNNLEWCTTSDNHKHAYNNNLMTARGENNNLALLTVEQVKEIRAKYKPRIYTLNMLAKDYNVSQYTIFDIIKRRTWNYEGL